MLAFRACECEHRPCSSPRNGIRYERVPGKGKGDVREHSRAPESLTLSVSCCSPHVFVCPCCVSHRDSLCQLNLLFNLEAPSPEAPVLFP